MRALLKIGVGLLLLAALLIALSYSMLRAQGVKRSANPEGRQVTSEARTVDGRTTRIDLSGPIELTLRQGAVPALTVRGEQRLLGNVDITQEGDVLHLGTKGMLLNPRHPIQVTLVLPRLDALAVGGSGDSTVNGFSGERIDIELNGSGNVKFNGRFKHVGGSLHGSGDMEINGGSSDKVELALVGSGDLTVVGACKQFRIDQTGSGDVDAEHLSAESASIELKGSGNASVSALQSLVATLHGSGDITVFGSPSERIINRSGSGDVEFR